MTTAPPTTPPAGREADELRAWCAECEEDIRSGLGQKPDGTPCECGDCNSARTEAARYRRLGEEMTRAEMLDDECAEVFRLVREAGVCLDSTTSPSAAVSLLIASLRAAPPPVDRAKMAEAADGGH